MPSPTQYNVFANGDEVLIEMRLDDGQRLELRLSHEQAAHLAMRLREGLVMGPQVAAAN